MSLSSFAVRRPVTMLMFLFAIILIGIVCLQRLPVELMPNISYKKISIIINIRGGMPPTEVETLVTKPIEEAIGTVTDLESIQSTSEKGKSMVVLRFKPGTDMDFAAMEVREKFAKIKNNLPKEIEKPVIAKYEETDMPVLIVAVTAIDQRYSPEVLRKLVDSRVKEAIQRVEGVANVDVAGGREQKILIEFDMHQLQKYKLPILKVINSLGTSNLNLMAGDIKRRGEKLIIRTIGQFKVVDEIKDLPIKVTPSGSIIRLKDVAEVKDSYLEAESEARVNQNPVVSLYIQKESTANTIQVCKSVEKALEDLWTKIDPNVRKLIVSNQANFILDAIDTVKDALLRGAILATVVLVVFLSSYKWARIGSLALIPYAMFMPKFALMPTLLVIFAVLTVTKISRSTLIMSISLPTSILLTFAFMLSRGISLNTMTLTGLALAIGMLSDNSIVVLDNIHAKIHKGYNLNEACIVGAQEMLIAIIAGTSTTIVVFIPFVFVSEQIKLLYGPLAQIVIFSLLVSLIIAVTFVPLTASRLKGESSPPLSPEIRNFFKKLLIFALRYRYVVFVSILFLALIALFIGKSLETEFLGTTEESKFTIFVELPDGAKLEMSDKVVKAAEELLKRKEKQPDGTEKLLFPEIKNISSWVKGWSSKVYVDLVPMKDRKRSTKEVIDAIRPYLKEIEKLAVAPTGEKAFLYFSEPKGTGSNEIFVDIYGHDYDALRKIAYEAAGKMQSIEGLTDVKIRITEGRPELNFKIDKAKAALFDLNVREISDIIHAEIRGLRATLFHTEAKEIEVIGRLEEQFRRYRKDMPFLVLDTPKGEQVILNQVSDFVPGIGPSEVWHMNKRRMIQVSANTGSLSLPKATEKIRESIKDIKLPKDFFWEFGGDYYLMLENRKQLTFCIILTILLVYMVLASLFESYIQPLIIMMTVPLAFIGVIFALKIANRPVSMGVLIGGIMSAGIVVNNGIILVDRINALQEKGFKGYHSVLITVPERLRPILITTITTLLGMLPMAIDRSEASGLWAPLAITVIGALTVSTVLTLIIVPIIYIFFEDIKGLFG